MNCEHIIGLAYDYEGATLATYNWLLEQHKDDLRSVHHFKDNPDQDICDGMYLKSATERAEKSDLSILFDKRRGRLRHFDYCPNCGEKINWAKLREMAKNQ